MKKNNEEKNEKNKLQWKCTVIGATCPFDLSCDIV